MKLETYRKNKGLTYTKLANLLALSRSTVFAICHRRGDITLRNAKAIKELTAGAVDYKDLLN